MSHPCFPILTLLLATLPSQGEPAPINDFTLKDLAGKPWSLRAQKDRATVLVFLSCECPMSNAYTKPLADLAAKYRDKGVALIGINANKEESPQQIAEHAREYRIAFPILKDDAHQAVKALGAKVNPEAFLLDDRFVVRYQGRIDDGYSARLKPKVSSRNDLELAIEDLLAGKPIRNPKTVGYGCPIPGTRRGIANPAAQAKTKFYRDVLPILQTNCQSCHRPNNIGPFSLMTYTQAARWADDIVGETRARRMPPWKPERNSLLAHERRLSDRDIATLSAWVEEGLAPGDPKDAPPPSKFVEGWQLGKPDLVLEMPSEAVIGPTGPDVNHCVVFPTNLPEDRYIAAIEVQPGNRRVVHHTLQLVDTRGAARWMQNALKKQEKPDAIDRGPGYFVGMGVGFIPNPANGLGGWAPGLVPAPLPEGVGMKLPKGADIVMQVHYHRTGKEERDRTRLGIFFTKGEVKTHFFALPAPGLFVLVPANKKDYKIDSSIRLTEDLTAHWLVPHMHLLGKDIELIARFPDGKEQSLIKIREWDYNWQEMYQLKEPLHLPRDTVLRVKATYDNSTDNPLNPNNPPAAVFPGEQTTNEMCFVFVGTSSAKPGWRKFTLAGLGGQ
jgi:peroxiredoxin